MITCINKECGYKVGWEEPTNDDSVRIEPPEGEFYNVGQATRWSTGSSSHVVGCPKCNTVFMSKDNI